MAKTKIKSGGLATDSVESDAVKALNITNAKIAAGTIDVTAKITGVVPTANLGSGSASASTYLAGDQSYKALSEYDDDAVQNDIATLALHQATNANAAKYNLTNTNVDVFQDSTGVATFTDCSRDTTGEYVASVTEALGRFASDADTSFLLHSNTTDGNTTFTDSSSNAHTITEFGGSNMENSTDYPPPTYLGTTAIHNTDGASGLTAAASSDWNFGTGEWTLEFWIYTNGTPPSGDRVLSWGDSGSNEIFVRPGWNLNGDWNKLYDSTGTSYDPGLYGSNPMDDTWVHYAFTRDVNTVRLYVGGVANNGGATARYPLDWTGKSTFTGSLALGILGSTIIGEYSTANVYLTEMRISKGICRYPDGTTFTPNLVATANATGNFVSTATTANASVSNVGIVITYKNNAGTNTLNTDIVAEVSANGGSNYTTCVLAAAGTFSTGVLQCVANDVSVTAGTSIQYRISFANQALTTKEARITGVSLIY